jgi:hypothetical protein
MPMYLPIVLAVVALHGPASHALPVADTMPKLDVARECQAEVDNEAGQKNCMDEENRTREQLEKEWQNFDVADRRQCAKEAEMGGASSYAEFLTCLEMARDTRNSQDGMNPDKQAQDTPKRRK